jgi:hypothetical protein
MELLDIVRKNLGKPYEDLEFLLNFLKEVMIESSEDELAAEIPWINPIKDFTLTRQMIDSILNRPISERRKNHYYSTLLRAEAMRPLHQHQINLLANGEN